MSKLKDRIVELPQTEQQNEGILKSEAIIWNLWENVMWNNICIIWVSEGEEREKGPEKLSEEIVIKKYPNLGKETDIWVQESQRAPNKMNPKRYTYDTLQLKW